MQVLWADEQVAVECPQRAQHARLLPPARIHLIDLGLREGRPVFAHQVGKGRLTHAAQQMTVQFDLGHAREQRAMRCRQRR